MNKVSMTRNSRWHLRSLLKYFPPHVAEGMLRRREKGQPITDEKNSGAGFVITTLCGASHWVDRCCAPSCRGDAINRRQWSEGDEN